MIQFHIGVDMDGVVAAWNTQFVKLIKQECGIEINTTQPWPTMWQWPKQYLSNKAITKLWDWIKINPWWWRMLPATETGVDDLRLLEQLHQDGHAIYFITSRPTTAVHRQTLIWLAGHGVTYPVVLLAKGPAEKALLTEGLHLDLMIDDKPANVEACARAGARSFIRDQPYNREFNWPDRVGSVREMWNVVVAEQMGKAA